LVDGDDVGGSRKEWNSRPRFGALMRAASDSAIGRDVSSFPSPADHSGAAPRGQVHGRQADDTRSGRDTMVVIAMI
jgi:hypothetical protein